MNSMSIVIPHHKDEKALEKLIISLQNQKTSVPFEVIVVSNPPSKAAEIFLKKYKSIVHLQTDVVGVNKARNLGIDKSKGDILIFLDSDCEMVTDNFLEQHYLLHQKNPHLSFLGGMYQYSGSRSCDLTYNYIQCRWLLRGLSTEGARYLIGGNFSAKRRSLCDHKFDENIKYGGSETEFFLRLRQNPNLKISLYQNLLVGHNTHLPWLGFIKKAYKQGSGACYIHRKLNQEIEEDYSHEVLSIFEKSKYKKDMDFWLSLYDTAYNKGYKERRALSSVMATYLMVSKVFNFYRIKGSNFFGSLESRLRNLSNQ